MVKNKFRVILGLKLSMVSLVLFVWMNWPIRQTSLTIQFEPGEVKVPVQLIPGQVNNLGRIQPFLDFPEKRSLILEWVPIIRLGDSANVELRYEVGDVYSSDQNSAIPAFPVMNEYLYQSYTIMAVTRLELFDSLVYPAGDSGQVLAENQNISFAWTITPPKTGKFEGITWFYLQFFPVNGGEMFEQAISAQTLDIKVVSLWGIKSDYWRILSALGLVLGLYLLIPLLKGLFTRISRHNFINN
jgi:hypothetical protein